MKYNKDILLRYTSQFTFSLLVLTIVLFLGTLIFFMMEFLMPYRVATITYNNNKHLGKIIRENDVILVETVSGRESEIISIPQDDNLLVLKQSGNVEYNKEIIMLETMDGSFAGIVEHILIGQDTISLKLTCPDAIRGGVKETIGFYKEQINTLNKEIEKLNKDKLSPISARYKGIKDKMKMGIFQFNDTQNYLKEVNYLEFELEKINGQINLLIEKTDSYRLLINDYSSTRLISLNTIINYYEPNNLTVVDKIKFVAFRFLQIFQNRSIYNTDNEFSKALLGTAVLILIMSLITIPIGIFTAIYLKFYIKSERLYNFFFIVIKNFAGVPSVVIGLFGLSFFIYFIGNSLDNWIVTSNNVASVFSTGGILWASFTMSLLTIPIMIVNIEEAISEIPKSISEAAYSMGCTKLQYIYKVILPISLPGIISGILLSISKSLGEIAPLMITGVASSVKTSILTSDFPYLALESKFLHLGYLIYDKGIITSNIAASIPYIFTLCVIILITITALYILARIIRKKYSKSFREIQ